MTIAHELSGEIADAILARRDQPGELQELKEVVLKVHMVLQNLTVQARKDELERRSINKQETVKAHS